MSDKEYFSDEVGRKNCLNNHHKYHIWQEMDSFESRRVSLDIQ